MRIGTSRFSAMWTSSVAQLLDVHHRQTSLWAELDDNIVFNLTLARTLDKSCVGKFIGKRQISGLFPHWDL
jgi:hypothetical protein